MSVPIRLKFYQNTHRFYLTKSIAITHSSLSRSILMEIVWNFTNVWDEPHTSQRYQENWNRLRIASFRAKRVYPNVINVPLCRKHAEVSILKGGSPLADICHATIEITENGGYIPRGEIKMKLKALRFKMNLHLADICHSENGFKMKK